MDKKDLNFTNKKELEKKSNETSKSYNSETETEEVNRNKISNKKKYKYCKPNKSKDIIETVQKKKYNNWTPKEDLLLLELSKSEIQQKWKKIALMIGNKTPRMCAYRIRKLKKFMKYNNELNKKKIFGFQNENDELKRIKISETLIKNEIQHNGFINFKKMRKKRNYQNQNSFKSTKTTSNSVKSLPNQSNFDDQQLIENNLSNLSLNEEKYFQISQKTKKILNEENEISKKIPTNITIKDVNMLSTQTTQSNEVQMNPNFNFDKLSSNNSILFAYSRNSSDMILDTLSINKEEFKNAYEKVFGTNFLKQSSSDTAISKGFFVEKIDKDKKIEENEKIEGYVNFDQLSIESYDDKFEQYLQLIENIINNIDMENSEKKKKLDDFAREIQDLSKLQNQQESKKYKICQSKIMQVRSMYSGPIKTSSIIIENTDVNSVNPN